MSAGTREALLKEAEKLMRSKGYAAFSYADLVGIVGIRKPSIHHHFPTKEDLGIAIVEGYINRAQLEFERIELSNSSLQGRLSDFIWGFQEGMLVGQLPLCGALAAEMEALPETLRTLTRGFFTLQLRWLTKVLRQAVQNGEIPKTVNVSQKAYMILSLMEGSSFVSWALGEKSLADTDMLLSIVTTP